MKKLVFVVFALVFAVSSFAQQTTPIAPTVQPAKPTQKKDKKKSNLIDQASDHLLIQFSSDHWSNEPDSIKNNQKGFSRGISIYLMFNKPFKSDPHWSVAYGVGLSNSNIFFKGMAVSITGAGTNLAFPNEDSTDHFKKSKLALTFLDIPVELRYTFHPEMESKSWKIALGVKAGIMLDAHTKEKELVDGNNNLINDYTQKESKSTFFQTTRFCGTARVGYGNFSLFTAYQINPIIKAGEGPTMNAYQIGFCLSGL